MTRSWSLLVLLMLFAGCQIAPATSTSIVSVAPTATVARESLPVTVVLVQPTKERQTPTVTTTSVVESVEPARDLRPSEHTDLTGLSEYHIILTLPDFARGNLEGYADIRYTNRDTVALPDILMRLYPNTPGYGASMVIESLSVNGARIEPTFELQRTAVRVKLPQAIAPGQVVNVAVTYHLTVPHFNQAGYGALNEEDEVMTLGGFYPAIAVHTAEGWKADLVTGVGDPVYAEAALFNVTVTVPSNIAVVSSGRTIEKASTENGAVTWRLVGGPIRDFALVLGKNYSVTTDNVNGVQVRFFYRASVGEAVSQQVMRYASDALRTYENLFSAYPYTELDIVQAPISASGLEVPGVVLLGARALNQGNDWLELVVAHETAHQWWYGLVGNDQVNAAWLDEGLASYSSILYFRENYGPDRAKALMWSYYQEPYQQQPLYLKRLPANLPVTRYSPDNYGPAVYIHATNFFYELHQALDEQPFLSLLRQYEKDYLYRIANDQDFVALAESFGRVSIVQALYSRWILGEP